MHVLPRVRELHERFADALSVIGVHAGKFVTERRTERIASAADRLGVHHAIVNDRHFRIWRAYDVQAWPTIALIDAEGYLVSVQSGEFDVASVAEVIAGLIDAADAKGVLARGPEPFVQLWAPEGGLLRYPSRVIESGRRLFVSDAGHGRVLEVELDASGSRGRIKREWDGFIEPQGLVADHDGALGGLFVADRGDHSVWRLGPDSDDRVRVAGIGRISERGLPAAGRASETALRSPWGIAAASGGLLVTMAGSHQIFALKPASNELELVAGSGAEDVRDGPGRRAALAQPTGLDARTGTTYFADCESSAVRYVSENGDVGTVVGTGLFAFGDRDGTGDEVLLQHCLDVASNDGVLAVADTYNDRVKRVDPLTRTCTPWPGEAGEAGALREPGGVSVGATAAAPGLIVADTGNHRVVRVSQDGSLAEIEIEEGR